MNKLNHIAFIMDGNGRWGKKRKKGRNFGHVKGVETVKKIVEKSIKLRYQTVAIFVGVLLISFSLLAGGWVKWQFFPVLEAEEVAIVVDLPEGTPISLLKK